MLSEPIIESLPLVGPWQTCPSGSDWFLVWDGSRLDLVEILERPDGIRYIRSREGSIWECEPEDLDCFWAPVVLEE